MVADRARNGDAPILPAPPGGAVRTAHSAGMAGGGGTGSVAIVDDDALVRTAMAGLLRSLGLPSDAFASAHEYLCSPMDGVACIVCDVQMPGTDGVQLLRMLRRNGIATPMILMTAFPNGRVRADAMAAGAAGYLEKPVNLEELIGCLELVLGCFR